MLFPDALKRKKTPAFAPGFLVYASTLGNLWRNNLLHRSEPVENLIGPEALEAVQRLVEHAELVGIDAADLLDRAHVLLVERVDDVADLAALSVSLMRTERRSTRER